MRRLQTATLGLPSISLHMEWKAETASLRRLDLEKAWMEREKMGWVWGQEKMEGEQGQGLEEMRWRRVRSWGRRWVEARERAIQWKVRWVWRKESREEEAHVKRWKSKWEKEGW